jgi:cobalt-zinc-cadmium efflux system outer membrane protein
MTSCSAKQAESSYPNSRPLIKNYTSQSAGNGNLQEDQEFKLPGVLGLYDALSLALLRNPELEAFSSEIRAAEARELQAGLLPNPELEAEVEDFGGKGDRSGFKGAESTLSIGQLIELGGKRGKRRRVASLSKELRNWDYESKRLDIFTKTSRAFIDVLSLQERLILVEETMELAQKMHNLVSEKVEAGKVSPLEKTKADVLLSTTQIEEDKVKKQLETARKMLASNWGSTSAKFQSVEGNLKVIPDLPAIEQLTPLTSKNPDLQRFTTETELRQSELRLAESRRVPDVTLRGGLKRFEDTSDYAFVVGFSVPLGVFDRNQGGIQEAKHNLTATHSLRNSERVRIETELSAAYQNLSSAHYQATTLHSNVLPAAETALEASSEGYKQGKLEYLDVLDAQRTLYDVKSQYIESLSSYHKAAVEVERLIGQEINKETGDVR